jgi:hypothetical protein
MPRLIERLAVVIAALALAVGVIVLLSGGLLAGRDAPGVAGADVGPGVTFADQGDTHLAPGDLQPVYDSEPPTSGAHVFEPVVHQDVELSDYQLLSALEVGDVVLMYGTPQPPADLVALARAVAPPFTPALALQGQAVILAQQPGIPGVIALAWTHLIHVASVSDGALRSFVEFWLGRGGVTRSGTLPAQ